MPRVIFGKQNVIAWAWGRFRRSLRAQGIAVALATVIPLTWYCWAQHTIEVQAQQKAAQQRESADALAAQQNAHEIASITSLFHFISGGDGKQNVALALNGDAVPINLRDDLASSVNAVLTSKYPTSVILPEVILPGFYTNGYFEKAFGGDLRFLDTAQFFRHEDVLLLIQPHIEFKDIDEASGVTGMRSCSVSLTCRAYTSTQMPVREVRLHSVGAAHSDEASLEAALGELKHNSQADSILAP